MEKKEAERILSENVILFECIMIAPKNRRREDSEEVGKRTAEERTLQ